MVGHRGGRAGRRRRAGRRLRALPAGGKRDRDGFRAVPGFAEPGARHVGDASRRRTGGGRALPRRPHRGRGEEPPVRDGRHRAHLGRPAPRRGAGRGDRARSPHGLLGAFRFRQPPFRARPAVRGDRRRVPRPDHGRDAAGRGNPARVGQRRARRGPGDQGRRHRGERRGVDHRREGLHDQRSDDVRGRSGYGRLRRGQVPRRRRGRIDRGSHRGGRRRGRSRSRIRGHRRGHRRRLVDDLRSGRGRRRLDADSRKPAGRQHGRGPREQGGRRLADRERDQARGRRRRPERRPRQWRRQRRRVQPRCRRRQRRADRRRQPDVERAAEAGATTATTETTTSARTTDRLSLRFLPSRRRPSGSPAFFLRSVYLPDDRHPAVPRFPRAARALARGPRREDPDDRRDRGRDGRRLGPPPRIGARRLAPWQRTLPAGQRLQARARGGIERARRPRRRPPRSEDHPRSGGHARRRSPLREGARTAASR